MKNIYRRILLKLHALDLQQNYTNINEPRHLAKVPEDSLLHYYGNIHSQRGQDGILGEIFRRIGLKSGRFVEFGAWDGLYLSNSRFLFERGWSGCYIEGNPDRFKKLVDTYRHYEYIKPILGYVGAPAHGVGDRNLSEILKNSGIDPTAIDFLSIDVDGVDLEIFEEMQMTPKVILMEGGSNFSPLFHKRISTELAKSNLQQPLPVILDAANAAGYAAVCFFQDTYLVRKDLLDKAFPSRTALELYNDMWNFAGDDFRNGLLDLRRNSKTIQQLELNFFKSFSAHPLEYRVD